MTPDDALAIPGLDVPAMLTWAGIQCAARRYTRASRGSRLMTFGWNTQGRNLGSPRRRFGTISALFGLGHGIITPAQYSYQVAAVISYPR